MMTNQEVYKTADSRRKAFAKYCEHRECETCPALSDYYDCHFNWLELPADVQLKPCPFCGGEAVIVELKKHTIVGCKTCFAVTQYGKDMLSAIEAWNHRSPSMNRAVSGARISAPNICGIECQHDQKANPRP